MRAGWCPISAWTSTFANTHNILWNSTCSTQTRCIPLSRSVAPTSCALWHATTSTLTGFLPWRRRPRALLDWARCAAIHSKALSFAVSSWYMPAMKLCAFWTNSKCPRSPQSNLSPAWAPATDALKRHAAVRRDPEGQAVIAIDGRHAQEAQYSRTFPCPIPCWVVVVKRSR
jgi:hypothetical protein